MARIKTQYLQGGVETPANTTYYGTDSSGTKGFFVLAGAGLGSITSVSAGVGMDFSTITTTGAVTLGLPSSLNSSTTNLASGTTHTHAISLTKADVGLANVLNVDTTNADNISDGATNAIITLTQETNFGTGYSHSLITTGNPHVVTKANVGLGNVPNVDCTNASNITSGTISSSVLPPVALTTVAVYTSEATMLAATTEEGDVGVRSDENKSYMRNAGVLGTMADWTELQTPTDSVLSVNGYTGTVVLNATDVGALDLTGGTLSGALTINSSLTTSSYIQVNDSGDNSHIGFRENDSTLKGHMFRVLDTGANGGCFIGVTNMTGNMDYGGIASYDLHFVPGDSNNYNDGTWANSMKLTATGKLQLKNGNGVNEFSIDGTLSGNSDEALVTEKAIKTYVDTQVSSEDFWDRAGTDTYLKNTGDNVGIGTTSPDKKVEIASTTVAGFSNNLLLRNDDSNGSSSVGLSFGLRDGGRIHSGILFQGDGSGYDRGSLHFLNKADTNTEFALTDIALTINRDRNVGIGTTSPSAKLHVEITNDVEGLRVLSDATSQENTILRNTGNNSAQVLHIIQDNSASTGNAVDIRNDGTGDSINVNSGEFVVDGSGNVGIGTTSPSSKLDVNGDSNFGNSGVVANHTFFTGSGGSFKFGRDNYEYIESIQDVSSIRMRSTGKQFYFGTEDSNELIFQTNSTNAIVIDTSQNVGIGTNSPATKLELEDGTFTIDQNTNSVGLVIDSEATTRRSLQISAALTGTDQVMYIANSGAQTSGTAMTYFDQANSGSTQGTMYIKNAGTGDTAFLDTNNDAISLSIDTEATSLPAFRILHDSIFTGTGSASSFYTRLYNASSTGTLMEGLQAGIGYGFILNCTNASQLASGMTISTVGNHNATNATLKLNKAGTGSGDALAITNNGIGNYITAGDFVVDSDANVGIGTTSPSAGITCDKFLEIQSSLHAGLVLHDTGQASPYTLRASGDNVNLNFGGTSIINFLSSGNVGIATTTPEEKLEVNGNILLSTNNSNRIYGRNLAGTKYSMLWYDSSDRLVYRSPTSGSHVWQINLTDKMSLDSSGKLQLSLGTGINEFSTDTTFAGNSDDAVPTEKATRTYVAAQIIAAAGVTRYAGAITAATSVTATHNMGTVDVIVQVYDSTGEQITPDKITTTNTNTVTIEFATATTGRYVIVG